MSPLIIELLLAAHTRRSYFEVEGYDSPAAIEGRQWLYDNELVDIKNFSLAKRGEVLVEHILNLPLPENKWEMPKC